MCRSGGKSPLAVEKKQFNSPPQLENQSQCRRKTTQLVTRNETTQQDKTTQQEKTTQLSSRNEQLNSAAGTKQLKLTSRNETTQFVGRALDWFEVLGYRVVEDKATDYAHLKQALSEQFPVVRNRLELETRFYASSQKHNQKPSDFVYDLLKIHKILKLEMTEEKLQDHVISRLEPQILDYVEVRHPQTPSNLLQIIDKYEERFLNRKIRGSSQEFRDTNQSGNNRFPNKNWQRNWRKTRGSNRYSDNSRGNSIDLMVKVLRIIDGRRRDQPGLTHVLYYEIDTGDQGPVVSRLYRYDRVKQGIIDYHIEKMSQEGTICPIQSPYASTVVLTRTNNGLPPDFPEAYRFAIDYRKLNAISKYPRYPLPVIDDLITSIPHTGIMSTLDLKSGYFQLMISLKDIEKTAFITRNGNLHSSECHLAFQGRRRIFKRPTTLY
ncbi:uncharacterized protein TNCV_1912651 [Trichonephila clavipes]|nr:uncharacterized protein TNCV_1912651 [Trichonephila clavipes]